MKKFLLRSIVLLSIMTVILVGAVGCKKQGSVKLDSYTEGLNQTSTSTEITQTIDVKKGSILVYARTQTYKKGDVGYTVTTVDKTLNELGSEEAYTETKNEEKVQIVSTFTSVLKLNDENFETQEVKDGTFSAKIKDSAVKTVFAFENEKVTITNAKLEMKLEDGKMAEMAITFKANGYDVEINISYKY